MYHNVLTELESGNIDRVYQVAIFHQVPSRSAFHMSR
jgi:hypothetical protein